MHEQINRPKTGFRYCPWPVVSIVDPLVLCYNAETYIHVLRELPMMALGLRLTLRHTNGSQQFLNPIPPIRTEQIELLDSAH